MVCSANFSDNITSPYTGRQAYCLPRKTLFVGNSEKISPRETLMFINKEHKLCAEYYIHFTLQITVHLIIFWCFFPLLSSSKNTLCWQQ
jgi:hypothetical protein